MRRERNVRSVSDPVAVGVHRASGGLPPYARRDRHHDLVDLLRPGRFVLVVGDAAAGKTRLAWEAVQATLGRHRLFTPSPGDLADDVDRMRASRRALLWLDDLERFLDVLSPNVIDELLADGHRVIVATMRLQEFDLLSTESDRTLAESRRRILASAEHIRVERRFSAAELARADRRHPAIAAALEQTEALAEHLAGGPALLARWREAGDQRGAALVSSAVDCRRAGYLDPLPVALLEEVHHHYLPADAKDEPTEQAWDWATERLPSALLERVGDTVTVFDYLVDHAQRTRQFDHVPAEVLRTALGHASAAQARSMGCAAAKAGRYELALEMHARTLDGTADVRENLNRRNSYAATLAHLGRLDEALEVHRAVLSARRQVLGPEHPDTLVSRTNVGNALNSLGRFEAALAEHRGVLSIRARLFGRDHPDTLTSRDNVAMVLNNLGRQDEALAASREDLAACVRVLGAEHPDTLISRHNLAAVLMGMGRFREAATELQDVLRLRRQALGPTHPETLSSRRDLITVLLENARYG
jgi:eukaryotic-like serine/threonine-protein kinase